MSAVHQHIASVLVLYLAGMMSSDKPSSSTTALYDLVYIRGVIHGWFSFIQAVAQYAYNAVLYCAVLCYGTLEMSHTSSRATHL